VLLYPLQNTPILYPLQRARELGLHRAQREREREDEYLELRRYGSQAHQRDPLVRRQFHQPSGAQPHCSESPSFSRSSLYSGVFFRFVFGIFSFWLGFRVHFHKLIRFFDSNVSKFLEGLSCACNLFYALLLA